MQNSKLIALISAVTITLLIFSCANLNLPTSFPTTTQQGGLSNAEIIEGLKEALTVGARNASNSASKTDGFFNNSLIFIPFPPEAIKVKNKLEQAGFKNLVDDFVLSLNRAAEDASTKALPIFTDAVKSMTIADAKNILKGADNAATNYLREKTHSKLVQEFTPVVKQSISKVKVTSYWNPVANTYNTLTALTGGSQVNPNLEEYITTKAVDGLFVLIAKEEALIRKDPAARVTDILKKVFGSN